MGDQQDGLFPALIPHGLEDDPFVQAVQIGGRLVQQEKGCIVQEGTSHTDALTLTAGECTAQLAHRGIISLGQAVDKAIQRGLSAGSLHLGTSGITPGDPDVVFNGIVKQLRFLGHKTFLGAQGGSVHGADVTFTKPDGAAAHIPEAHEQPQEGGFAAAGAARDAHDLLFRDGQAQVMEHFFLGVGKADMLSLCTGKDGIRAVGHIGSHGVLVQQVKDTLAKYGLGCWSISNHLAGQCVCDTLPGAYDSRLDGFAPAQYAGDPAAIQAWAVQEMKDTAHAAKAMGVDTVTFFMGSPIWKLWYSFPQTSEAQVEAGYQQVKELWSPIMDEFDACGVKLALEIHPTEIAFDYWSTKKLLDVFDRRPTLGINFDPSHLIWQGLDPQMFLLDFADRIYHVHVKDAKLNLNGRNGILGSHITFGDQRRGWNFVSPGHGDVDFDNIIRALNQIGYTGPLSIEWEDSGMERVFGGTEACAFTKKINFSASDVAFDDAIKNQ